MFVIWKKTNKIFYIRLNNKDLKYIMTTKIFIDKKTYFDIKPHAVIKSNIKTKKIIART